MPDTALMKPSTTPAENSETFEIEKSFKPVKLASKAKPIPEKEGLQKIINMLHDIRLNSKHSEGQGFLYNAEANILGYLQFVDKK